MLQRQIEYRNTGTDLDFIQHLLYPRLVRRRHNKPEIEIMFTLVIMIDLVKPADESRYRFQLPSRGQPSQQGYWNRPVAA